jgi:hypothetical protein
VVLLLLSVLALTACPPEPDGGSGNGGSTATINIPAIDGVTAPVTGGTPVIAITANDQYTGLVTWNGNPSAFDPLTIYTATITLTVKTGYTLQGVTANFFKVAGTTSVSNDANSGIITAVFPATIYGTDNTGPGGGKVFYYSKAGFTMTDTNEVCHYLEAAPADMPTTLAWASSAFIPPGNGGTGDWVNISGTGTDIGTGRKNTELILATDVDAPAAKACKDYSNGGKTDWFLPSKDELNELYVVRMGQRYWSSSQRHNGYAWYHDFGMDIQSSQANYLTGSVRAIRAF